MRKTALLASACLAVLACAPFAARAGEAISPEQFAKRLFGASAGGQTAAACFVHRYDDAHLARHPKQTVRVMRLLVSAEKLKDDSQFSYSLKFGINLRNRPGSFVGNEFCGHLRPLPAADGGTSIQCRDGCEGGGVQVALGPNNRSVMLSVDDLAIWRAENPNDEKGQAQLKGGVADRHFRLDRVDLQECAGLPGDDGESETTPTQ